MTLTSAIKSAPAINTFEPVELPNGIHDEERDKHIPPGHVNIVRKSIRAHKISETEKGFLSITAENFLANLPHEISSELKEIQAYCSCNRNLLNILNGDGKFYNRLIITLLKIDNAIATQGLTTQQALQVEKKLNLDLTDGKIDLKNELGLQINHLNKQWTPTDRDQYLFRNDTKNCKKQLALGEFHPKWMLDVKLADTPIAQATFDYWNIRHDKASAHRDNMSDSFIHSSNSELHQWLLEMRKLRRLVESSTEELSQPALPLSKLQIAVVTQRLNFADERANSARGFNAYHWTGPKIEKPNISKQRKPRRENTTAKQASTTTTARTSARMHTHKPFLTSEQVNRAESTGRIQRKHTRNTRLKELDEATAPKYLKTSSATPSPQHIATTPSDAKDSDEFEKTEISDLVSHLQTFLNYEENRLAANSHSPNGETPPAIITVLSARDELSRLRNACKLLFKRPQASNYTEHPESDQKRALAEPDDNENIFDKPKDENPDKYKDLVAPPEYQKLQPELEPLTPQKKETGTDQSKHLDALITATLKSIQLAKKSRDLLFKSEALSLTLEAPDDVQGWQSLETIINFPLKNLNQILKFRTVNSDLPELIFKKQELFRKICSDIKHYKDKSKVWNPCTAQLMLQSHWEELMTLQYQLHALRDEAWMAPQDIPVDTKCLVRVKNIDEHLHENTSVLCYLTSFSLRLKTERHQELYEKLRKATK